MRKSGEENEGASFCTTCTIKKHCASLKGENIPSVIVEVIEVLEKYLSDPKLKGVAEKYLYMT